MCAMNAGRVLVVNDELSIRRLMRLYLTKAGFTVKASPDAGFSTTANSIALPNQPVAGAWAVGYWDMRRRLRGAEGGPGGRTPPGTRDGYVLAA